MTTAIVKKYTSDLASAWNELIASSKNGTFLFNRNFMEYHSHKFVDHSLMFYHDDKLVAVLPANSVGNILYSHQGLSYGGIIYDKQTKTKDILLSFNALKDYCAKNDIARIIYKRVPYIYHNYPSEEDLYGLFMINAKLVRRDIGYVIDIRNPIKFSELRRRMLNKGIKANLIIREIEEYDEYRNLLEFAIAKHDAKPVHSSAEMSLLAKRFPENIKLFCCYKDEIMLGGVWLFVTNNAVHTQYIANSEEGQKCGSLETLVTHIMQKYNDLNYFSFGISTENNGRYLNEGLTWQKESFGARGITHDFYELTF